MTRRYKLERLQKNILLGVSGMALAGAIAISGAQTTTNSVATGTNINATTSTTTLKNLAKANKKIHTLCKKDALKERSEAKKEADEKYASSTKALKAKRLSDLMATKTATGTATSTKALNKERHVMRLNIERQYQTDLKALKAKRHAERVKADEAYDNKVCEIASSTKLLR